MMSDMSELGPIDPQILLFDEWRSVQNYLDAYKAHAETLKTDRDNIAAQIMLGKLYPATLKLCEAALNRGLYLAGDATELTNMCLYFSRESAINLVWPMSGRVRRRTRRTRATS